MDRDVMVFTRWIRLAALVVAGIVMLVTGGTTGYIFAAVCLVFLAVTVWQLSKLHRDEKYRS